MKIQLSILILILSLSASLSVFADTLNFAAFTGVYVCGNNEQTGGQEVCRIELHYEPNVSFERSGLPSKLSLDHTQYGLKIKTIVSLSENASNSIYKLSIKVESLETDSLNNLVDTVSINTKDIDSLGALKVTGKKICTNASCSEWLIPFIHLGPAFEVEDPRDRIKL